MLDYSVTNHPGCSSTLSASLTYLRRIMFDDDDVSHFDLAQICLNGHVVNSMARDYPASNSPYCAKCGEPTMTACPTCKTEMRGFFHVPGTLGLSRYSPPAFCYQCGKPFPWTESGLAAARELVDTFDTLSPDDKSSLQDALPELVKDTPRTKVAEAKYRAITKKVGKDAYDGLRSIVVDIASEAVKKSLFGP